MKGQSQQEKEMSKGKLWQNGQRSRSLMQLIGANRTIQSQLVFPLAELEPDIDSVRKYAQRRIMSCVYI